MNLLVLPAAVFLIARTVARAGRFVCSLAILASFLAALAAAETKRLSPGQVEEVEQALEELSRFAQGITRLGLSSALKPPKISSREDVRKEFLSLESLDDSQRKRLQRQGLILRKFRLLPPDFSLLASVDEISGEIVRGLYHSPTDTIHLVDSGEPTAMTYVLLHEIVHALQRQNANWFEKPEKFPDEVAEEDFDSLAAEERTALRALSEGQAGIVVSDRLLQKARERIRFVGSQYSMEASFNLVLAQAFPHTGSQAFAKAPLYIRATIRFPYVQGFWFVYRLRDQGDWAKGTRLAFAEAIRKPPRTTHEILNPESYLKGESLEPLRLPKMQSVIGRNHERLAIGPFGELEVSIFLEQFLGKNVARNLAPKWRGGVYYATLKPPVPPSAPTSKVSDASIIALDQIRTDQVALLYVSRWDSRKSAEQFAAKYASALSKRYKSVTRIPNQDARSTAGSARTTRWETEEGLVVVEAIRDLVVVTESFDPTISEALRGWYSSLSPPVVSR